MTDGELPEVSGYKRSHVAVSAAIGVGAMLLAIWWAQGFDVFYESLYRVNPGAGAADGIGADWVAGNSIPALDFLIALIHAADVILGMFILVLMFLHWAAFRRLAGQMRQPGEERSTEAVATDGGEPGGEDQ